MVFGVGDPHSELMFIGEGPGENEDLQGEPFVGAAGKLLDDMLEMIDLRRSQVYIANVVKCRPPRNRDPLGEEQAACRHWLDAQREIIRPKLIVCLGRIAAMRLIKPDFKITKEHGIWTKKGAFEICAVYHPSLLLRDPLFLFREALFCDLGRFLPVAALFFSAGTGGNEKGDVTPCSM